MQGMADWAAPDRHDGPVQAKCKMAAAEHRPGAEAYIPPCIIHAAQVWRRIVSPCGNGCEGLMRCVDPCMADSPSIRPATCPQEQRCGEPSVPLSEHWASSCHAGPPAPSLC